MRIFRFILIAVTILMLSTSGKGFAGDDELIVYPDGSFGIDLGEGYETMPDGELMPPGGYREDYKSTSYGAMTSKGFVVFPDFRFPGTRRKIEKVKSEEKEINDYIFYEATTSTPDSLWGVSSPREK